MQTTNGEANVIVENGDANANQEDGDTSLGAGAYLTNPQVAMSDLSAHVLKASDATRKALGAGKVNTCNTKSLDAKGIKGAQKDVMLEVSKKIEEESQRYKSFTFTAKPWEEDDMTTKKSWSELRILMAKLMMSGRFESTMGIVIFLNIGLIIWETNHQASCYPGWRDNMEACPWLTKDLQWLSWVNRILLVIYTLECGVGIYAFRRVYFKNQFNRLDCFVAFTGWGEVIWASAINLSYMKIFRVARLIRAARVLIQIRELYLLLAGFISSIKAIVFGMLLLGGMLLVSSIVLVEFIHPISSALDIDGCERCSRVFDSVPSACLTLFQHIVAGDSWGNPSVAIIEKEPWTAIVLVSIVVVIAIGVMNLILAVIVESASDSLAKDMEEKARSKQRVLLQDKMTLLELVAEMDKDCDGTVTLEELLLGFDKSADFRSVMLSLEVRRGDLQLVYKLMDSDGNGAVNYQEFVDELYMVSTCDLRMIASLCKVDVAAIKRDLEHFLKHRFEEHSTDLDEKLDEHARRVDGRLDSVDEQIRSMSRTLALVAKATVPGFDDKMQAI